MSRIGATLSGFQLKLLDLHAGAVAAANINNLRLASGQNINAARDDVSGFVALDRFQSDLANVRQASTNLSNASAIVSGAQLLADQIRTQLDTIRAKAVEDEDQELTADERAANQAAIDAAIDEINRLATTEVAGRRVLDGSADFRYSGENNSQIADLAVHSLGGASSRTVSGSVTAAATQATRTYTGALGQVNSGDATIVLSGSRGSAEISVTNGENLTALRDRINLESHVTGVTAEVAGDTLTLTSVDYGTAETVDVEESSGVFSVAGSGVGTDATATINGQDVTGRGNRFTVSDNGLRLSVEFEAGFTGAFDTVTVSGTALAFALSTDLDQLATLALPGLQAARLGGPSGTLDQLGSGEAAGDLDDNASTAIRIVDEALGELDRVEGLLDGFADAVITSSADLLDGLDTNLSDAIDAINLVDESREEALLARNEALASNALAALANIDLHQQRILQLVQQVTGFNSF